MDGPDRIKEKTISETSNYFIGQTSIKNYGRIEQEDSSTSSQGVSRHTGMTDRDSFKPVETREH